MTPNSDLGENSRPHTSWCRSSTGEFKRVVQHIKNEKAQRRSTGAVFMDVEKAFDAVWHNGLIHKLLKYKFPLHIIKMIKNYLSGRKFAVFADGSVSNWKQMEAGLPQGSPLSAILYSIYTADIPVPRDCLAAFFADDAAYLASAKNSNAIVRKLNKILVRIDNYYCDWKIKINAEKTQAVIFPFNRSNKRIPNLQIRVRDIAIQPQQKAKYLGLTLDAHLNFAEHIKDIRKKSYAKMAALYPLLANKHLSIKNKLIIYKATLRPSITYAAPIWVDIAPTHLKTLQIFQNKCLKSALHLNNRFQTTEFHRRACVPLLVDFIANEQTKFAHRCQYSAHEIIKSLY